MAVRPRALAFLFGASLVGAGCSEYLALPEASPVAPGTADCPTTVPAGPWRITGDADADPHVWAVGPDGTRHEVAWPPGFKSVFWPDLVVLDAESRLVAHGNDDLTAPPPTFDGLVVCFEGSGVTVRPEADVAR